MESHKINIDCDKACIRASIKEDVSKIDNNSNKDNKEALIEEEYDMLDDEQAQSALREQEEDEAFQRKFAAKKNQHKKKMGTLKRLVDYLFDSTNRQMPPILRLFAAIFEPQHLTAFVIEEVVSRAVSSNSDQDKGYNEEDDKILLEMIPDIEMKDSSKLPNDKKDCIVCVEPFKDGDIVTILPCLHFYHSQCIRDWFKNSNLCPICRYKITEENFK